jgi:hypothetical protein
MVDAIHRGDFDAGFKALVEHTDLIHHHPVSGLLGKDPSEEASEQLKEQA